MTMNASQDEVQYLSTQLFENGKLVTYKTLSRALNIHINQAKLSLYEFYEKNKSKLGAKLIVTGKNEDGTLIKIINDGDEESIKSDLTEFTIEVSTIQVYSINPKDLILDNNNNGEIIQQLRQYPIDLTNLDQYYKNGILKGPEVVPVEQSTIKQNYVAPPSSTAETKQCKDAKKKEEPKVKSSGLTSSYVSRKEKPVARSNTLSSYTSRKGENASTKRTLTEPAGYQYKSRKVESKQPKERIIVSSHQDDEEEEEDDHDEKEDDIEEVKPTKSTQIQDLFADEDWNDWEDDSAVKDEPIVVEEGSTKQKPKEKDEQEQDKAEEVKKIDVEDSVVQTEMTSQSLPKEEEEDMTTERDEDGYIITKKKKSVAKPPPASRNVKRIISTPPTTTKSKKAKSDGKNQSILNFFGKNK